MTPKHFLSIPLSIKIIAGWYLAGALNLLSSGREEGFVLGLRVFGPWGLVYNVLLAAVMLSLAVGLWRLSEVARRSAIGLESYTLLNWLLGIALPSNRQAALDKATELGLTQSQGLISLLATCLGASLSSGLIIVFLVKRTGAFKKVVPKHDGGTLEAG